MKFCRDLCIHNLNNMVMVPKIVTQSRWSKPPFGTLKINFDAAWEDCKAGIDFLTHDSDSFVHGGNLCFKDDVACVAWAKVGAFIQSILWEMNNSLTNLIIEGDYADIINRILNPREDVTLTGHLLHVCNDYLADFDRCSFIWCLRNYNRDADTLSKMAFDNSYNFSFDMNFPSEIQNILISDSY